MKEQGSRREWPENLFVEHAPLFLQVFKKGVQERTPGQIDGLVRLFDEFDVPKRGRILDLCCGVGRHSIPLAKKGYTVLGLDLSTLFIHRAENSAREENVAKKTRFYVGDARLASEVLKDEEPFDVMLNLWTSHGYYSDEDDLRMFSALKTLAGPRCLLVVDSVNRDFLVSDFQGSSITDLGRLELHERRKMNMEDSRLKNQWSFYEKGKGVLRLRAKVNFANRLYSLHELKAMLERAGWRYLKCYGDFSLQAFSSRSPHMIVCCRARRRSTSP